MTKDYLGRQLTVGDFVIYMRQGYRELRLAQIIKFTTTGKVRISWKEKWGDRDLLQEGNQLVKVEGEELTFFLLNQKG
jgi:hypothetical protein